MIRLQLLDGFVAPAVKGTAPSVDQLVPTLNISAESVRLFNVLSVEVFKLRCVSTFVETQPTLNKRTSILNRHQTACRALETAHLYCVSHEVKRRVEHPTRPGHCRACARHGSPTPRALRLRSLHAPSTSGAGQLLAV